ncbi:hypothetical protein PR048_013669 [Dryococelus australis]|uniref:Uncharacterized protein n=1 Tax=Dryococelus australis TaxID=614101 RepID=A0ABQ9HTN5_9NEOP|nr:hypothetical protein PR048_013669 [Dryococelus australis]
MTVADSAGIVPTVFRQVVYAGKIDVNRLALSEDGAAPFFGFETPDEDIVDSKENSSTADLISYFTSENCDEALTLKDAMDGLNAFKYQGTIEEEINPLKVNETFEWPELPPGNKPLHTDAG